MLLQKKGDIISCLTSKRLKQKKTVDESNLLLNANRDCEKVLLSHLKLPHDTVISADILEDCTLAHFHGYYVPIQSTDGHKC